MFIISRVTHFTFLLNSSISSVDQVSSLPEQYPQITGYYALNHAFPLRLLRLPFVMPLITSLEPIARPSAEAAGSHAIISRADRSTQTSRVLAKIREGAESGLEFKFALLSMSVGGKPGHFFVGDTHLLSKLLDSSLHHLERYDMQHIFTEFPRIDWSDPAHPIFDPALTVNLLSDYDSISPVDVAKTTQFLRQRIPPQELLALQQDLDWSTEFYLSSCVHSKDGANSLRDQVHADYVAMLRDYPLSRGGPLVLRLLLARVSASDAITLRALSNNLKSIKVSNIEGEDIKFLCQQLEAFLLRLEAANKIPDQVSLELCGIFATSSDSEFSGIFGDMRRELLRRPDSLSWREVLKDAKDIYERLCLNEKWCHVNHPDGSSASKNESFFQAEIVKAVQSMLLADGGSSFNLGTSSDSKSDHDRSSGLKRGPLFDYPNPKTGDTKIQSDPNRWEKMHDGKSHHWCGKCNGGKGRWTYGRLRHHTDEHRGSARAALALQSEPDVVPGDNGHSSSSSNDASGSECAAPSTSSSSSSASACPRAANFLQALGSLQRLSNPE